MTDQTSGSSKLEAFAYILFWGLILYGFLTQKKHVLLYILFGVMPFGSFAVISPKITGVTLTVAPIVMLIFIARTFLVKDGLNQFVDISLAKNKLLLLFMFWLTAIFLTLTMPRFFQGDVMVIPMSLSSLYAVPIEPTTQNFTQLVYISISILAVYSFAVFLQDLKMRQHAIKAICLAGFIAIVTGVLDYSSQYVKLDIVLDAFRNANYGLATEQMVFESKRINGLMPEPSAFANLCISLLATLYFFRRAIDSQVIREKIAPLLIVALIGMVWLSTSSSGLVGLALFGFLAITEWAWRARSNSKNKIAKRGLMVEIVILNILLIASLTVFLVKPQLFNPIIEMFDTMVFKKTESSSYEERSMWTTVSWQALLDSYGIGIGLGSTRASNGFVTLTSSVGFIGAMFYYSFLLQSFFRKAATSDEYGDVMMTAFRWSFVPPFVVDLLIGTTPDFGLFNAFRYGLVLAIAIAAMPQKRYRSVY